MKSAVISHSQDIEAYMDGKDKFVKKMETKALQWQAAIELNSDRVPNQTSSTMQLS